MLKEMAAIMPRPAVAPRMTAERTNEFRCEPNRSPTTAPDVVAAGGILPSRGVPRRSEGSAAVAVIECRGGGGSAGKANVAALRVATWLRLAGAPTFAVMALLVGVANVTFPNALCGGGTRYVSAKWDACDVLVDGRVPFDWLA